MPAEAAYRVTVKNSKGHLYTLGGDSYADFEKNLTDALGADGAGLFLSDYREAFGVQPVSEAQAVANVQAAFPGTTVAPPVSTIGGFTPPGAPAAAPVSALPPTVIYPGDCQHGARQFKDSIARGKPWQRWECAIPWSKDAQGRCKPVNV